MGKFDGILICTDLDGTLFRNDKTVSAATAEAIEYFKREGGRFTFVTGRMPSFVSDVWEAVRPNAPFGCINGGGLYDYEAGRYVWTMELPRAALALVRAVDEELAGVGFQVNTFDKVYFCKENNVMEAFRRITGAPNLVRHYDEIDEPIAKVVFGCSDEGEILRLERFLRSHPMADDFDFIRSERSLFEILPKGSGKGTAVGKLTEHLGLDPHKTVAVGDYNNDISMFEAAGVGIAVANACPEALAAADFVTVSNEEDAIARVIYDLAAGKYIS